MLGRVILLVYGFCYWEVLKFDQGDQIGQFFTNLTTFGSTLWFLKRWTGQKKWQHFGQFFAWAFFYNFTKSSFNGTEHFKNVNSCWNTNISFYLETSGGQRSNLYLNVVHFFQHQCLLDICGSFRELFSCIGVWYILFYWALIWIFRIGNCCSYLLKNWVIVFKSSGRTELDTNRELCVLFTTLHFLCNLLMVSIS